MDAEAKVLVELYKSVRQKLQFYLYIQVNLKVNYSIKPRAGWCLASLHFLISRSGAPPLYFRFFKTHYC